MLLIISIHRAPIMSKNNPQSSRPSRTAHRKDQNSGLGKARSSLQPRSEGGAQGQGAFPCSAHSDRRLYRLARVQELGLRQAPGAQGRGRGHRARVWREGATGGMPRVQDPPILQSRIRASDSPEVSGATRQAPPRPSQPSPPGWSSSVEDKTSRSFRPQPSVGPQPIQEPL